MEETEIFEGWVCAKALKHSVSILTASSQNTAKIKLSAEKITFNVDGLSYKLTLGITVHLEEALASRDAVDIKISALGHLVHLLPDDVGLIHFTIHQDKSIELEYYVYCDNIEGADDDGGEMNLKALNAIV